MTDDMLSWLREQIEARKALAEAASPGPWTANAEHDEVLAADGITVADGFALSGRQLRATVDHIVFNDPRQIIADCEYDLATLDEHRRVDEHDPDHGYDEAACYGCAFNGVEEYKTPDARDCPVVKRLAYRYRCRPGYLAEWAPEGVTP